jgi:hypothetical protein
VEQQLAAGLGERQVAEFAEHDEVHPAEIFGHARTNSIRLWHSRTCATFTVTVVPLISAISWLQSN